MTERVEPAPVDQRLDRALVEHARVDAVAEIMEIGERSPALALLDQQRRYALADVAYCGEAEPNRVTFTREVAERCVDIGDEHRDVEMTTLAEIDRGLVEV